MSIRHDIWEGTNKKTGETRAVDQSRLLRWLTQAGRAFDIWGETVEYRGWVFRRRQEAAGEAGRR